MRTYLRIRSHLSTLWDADVLADSDALCDADVLADSDALVGGTL